MQGGMGTDSSRKIIHPSNIPLHFNPSHNYTKRLIPLKKDQPNEDRMKTELKLQRFVHVEGSQQML